jgi:hypothetical protein
VAVQPFRRPVQKLVVEVHFLPEDLADSAALATRSAKAAARARAIGICSRWLDFKPLLKLVSVLQLIPELVKQTLCFIYFSCAGSSFKTVTNDVGFLSMRLSCVLTEGVRCFVEW